MKFVLVCVVLVSLLTVVVNAEIELSRVKRAACDSTYGDWGEWSTCDKDCGYCGTQYRTRVCAAISGCTTVTCTGDASESQACSTSDSVCLAPSGSCCGAYKKAVNIPLRRFYCAPE